MEVKQWWSWKYKDQLLSAIQQSDGQSHSEQRHQYGNTNATRQTARIWMQAIHYKLQHGEDYKQLTQTTQMHTWSMQRARAQEHDSKQEVQFQVKNQTQVSVQCIYDAYKYRPQHVNEAQLKTTWQWKLKSQCHATDYKMKFISNNMNQLCIYEAHSRPRNSTRHVNSNGINMNITGTRQWQATGMIRPTTVCNREHSVRLNMNTTVKLLKALVINQNAIGQRRWPETKINIMFECSINQN